MDDRRGHRFQPKANLNQRRHQQELEKFYPSPKGTLGVIAKLNVQLAQSDRDSHNPHQDQEILNAEGFPRLRVFVLENSHRLEPIAGKEWDQAEHFLACPTLFP